MNKVCFVFLLVLSGIVNAGPLDGIQAWGYQLHKYNGQNITDMINSRNTLWVIDYSKDGDEANKFTPQEIASIKANGNKVISYFCLGEAEVDRFYWKDMPHELLIKASDAKKVGYGKDWSKTKMPPLEVWPALAPGQTKHAPGIKPKMVPNPDQTEYVGRGNASYKDNFPVQYWTKGWQDIMINQYLAKVLDAGFDGVYLDTVDAFEYYAEGSLQKQRADQMYNYILRIGGAGKARNPNFIVIMQNAMSIANTDFLSEDKIKRLFSVVNGFGVEDLFYPNEDENGAEKENNKKHFSKNDEAQDIQAIVGSFPHVKFFIVDYLTGPYAAKEKSGYFRDALKNGYTPLLTSRQIDGSEMIRVK